MRIDQPFFSVVIPIYNVEDFLQEALLSIENQTYKNIELVLIDDGSSDLSWKLIEDFQKTSRLKVSFIFQENKGLSAVRNRGIKEASGEYVYFLDSDDAVQSDLFEKIAERIMKDELEVIFFDGEVFVEEGVESPYKEDFYRHKVMDVTQAYSTEEYYGLGKVLPNVPLYVMKKDLLLENAISFEEGIYHEDEVFTPKVLRAAERIGAVEGIFYKRRWRPGSIMSTTSLSHLQKRIQSQKKVVELLEEFLDRNKAEIQENERGFLEGKIRYFQDVAVKNEEKMELELQNMKENERDLPKVSIIIPVYNVEDFLDETLGSVASQTYTAIELILVDDGSTDGSQQVMQDFKKGHEDDFDIRILYQENQGQSAARNYGVAESTGDYIYFLDSDDFIDPETIEVLVERSLKDDLDLVLFQAIPFKEEGVVLARPLEVYENYYQYKKMSDETVYTFEEMLAVEHMKPSPCLYLTRKTLIEEFDITFLKGVIHEDEIYTAKLAHHAKRIGLVRERFYHRRYRANSTMTGNTKSHLLKKMNGYKSVIHGLTDLYYEEFSELEVNEKKWLEHKIEYFFRILWEMPGNDKIDLLLLETELPVQLKHSKKALILLKMLPVLRRVFPIYKKIKTSIVKEEG